MAFGAIYIGYAYNYYSEKLTATISKEGFDGLTTDLTLTGIDYMYNANEQLITKSCDLSFINTFSFNALDDLFRNYERQYKLVVTDDTGFIHFEGYMIVDIIEQTFLQNSKINLVFSDYLKRLKDIEPSIIDVLGERKHFLEIIQDCLDDTGFEYPLYINNHLYGSENTMTAGNTMYEQSYVDVDLFWKNNEEKDTAYDILNAILKISNSFLYVYNGAWYIERYDDISDNSTSWTQFAHNAASGSALSNKFQSYTKQDGDFNYVGTSQNIAYNSGVEEFELKLDDINYNTLIYNNYPYDAVGVNTDTILPLPDLRDWQKTVEVDTHCSTHIFKRNSYGVIQHPIHLGITHDGTWEAGETYDNNERFKTRGVFTKFHATVEPIETTTTTLKVNWKISPNSTVEYVGYYKTYWYIKMIETDSSGKYVHYNQDDVNNPYWELLASDATTGVNSTKYSPDDLENGFYDMSISIPLSEIDADLIGDHGFILGFCYTVAEILQVEYWLTNTIIGDFTASISSTLQDNSIVATLNEGFIKKESETLKIFDIENLNYKNGIYRYDAYGGLDNYWRTSDWTEDGGDTYRGLTEHYLASKYKFLNKNTMSLGGRILSPSKIKPLAILYDTNQQRSGSNIPILLKSFKYDAEKCIYDISSEEYSEDTIIINY